MKLLSSYYDFTSIQPLNGIFIEKRFECSLTPTGYLTDNEVKMGDTPS